MKRLASLGLQHLDPHPLERDGISGLHGISLGAKEALALRGQQRPADSERLQHPRYGSGEPVRPLRPAEQAEGAPHRAAVGEEDGGILRTEA